MKPVGSKKVPDRSAALHKLWPAGQAPSVDSAIEAATKHRHGILTNLPISAPERLVFGTLGVMIRDRDALLVGCTRLEILARHLATAEDVTIRVGAALAFAALAMVHGTRPALDVDDYLAKGEHASVQHDCRKVRTSLALRACMSLDVPADSPWANPGLREAHLRFLSEDLAESGAASPAYEPDAEELRLFKALGRMWEDRDGFRNAIARLSFFRDVFGPGLGLGLNPDLIKGLSLSVDALMLLYAARPSTMRVEVLEKRVVLNAHMRRGGDYVGAVLAALLEADCIALGLEVEDLA